MPHMKPHQQTRSASATRNVSRPPPALWSDEVDSFKSRQKPKAAPKKSGNKTPPSSKNAPKPTPVPSVRKQPKKLPSNLLNHQLNITKSSQTSIAPTVKTFNSALSANVNEAKLTCYMFHDYVPQAEGAGAVLSCDWNISQDLLGNVDSSIPNAGATMAKVEEVDVYILPSTSIGSTVAEKTVVVEFCVPVRSGAEASPVLAAMKNTVVRPNFNIGWIRCGYWAARELFKEANIIPYATSTVQRVGSLSIVNPDTGAVWADTSAKFQVCFVVRCSQQMPVSNQVNAKFTQSASWTNDPQATSSQFALIELDRVTNTD